MSSSAAKIGLKQIETAERSELVRIHDHYVRMGNEWLRRQILDNNRTDILAQAVLGYQCKPFHLAMMRWQFLHPDNLQLVFRGAGKSTVCTVTKSIHLLLKNPNLRVCIASKTSTAAEAFLKEIKAHFEENEKLIEIFGEYYDPRKVNKWDAGEIEVLPRTSRDKEASITCIGVGAMAIGKHYDVVIPDDLIDEDNSRTQHQRDKTKTWYYKVLDPTVEPPDHVEHRGEIHRQGTRYHYDDLYGHFLSHELKEHTNIIPALDEHGRSPWPEKYTPEWFDDKRKKSGIIIFNSQYQCDTEAMKGEIFQYDDCLVVKPSEVPSELRIFMGVDLAISEISKNDKFAIVVIGRAQDGKYYILYYYENQLRFGKQTEKILEIYKRYDPIRCAIEINAYQDAQYQNLRDNTALLEKYGLEGKDLRLKGVHTHKDKITRAWKLSPYFEDKRMHFLEGQHLLIEHLVLFPSLRLKDLFDALDLAVKASKLRKRRRNRAEPGLI